MGEMVCAEPVAMSALGVGVQLAEPRRHVRAAMEVPAIRLLDRLELPARYALERAARQRISQSYETAELPVSLSYRSSAAFLFLYIVRHLV